MVGAEEDDGAVALGVEAGGDVLEGLLDDVLDALLGDGEVLAEGVVGAAVLDVLEEGASADGRGGCHFVGGCGGGGKKRFGVVVDVGVFRGGCEDHRKSLGTGGGGGGGK